MSEKQNNAQADPKPRIEAKIDTITCKHCRYEYAADLKHCSICGYPWPWLKESSK